VTQQTVSHHHEPRDSEPLDTEEKSVTTTRLSSLRSLRTRPSLAPATGAPTIGVASMALAVGLALSLGCGDTIDDALEGGGDGATFTRIYEDEACSGCHAPGAPGRMEGMEATQNWSSRAAAFSSLQGNASGLIGNFQGCNGVPLIGSSADESLLIAALDFDVRSSFSVSGFPDCTGDAIADQTDKINGGLPDGWLDDLKDWIDAGAPNN
jgi:cytochrome c5